ncbi:CD9 antigen, partial [Mortierella sp. AD031]
LLLTHVNAHVAYSYCIRWVEVRLQALSAVVILVVAVGFVLSAGKDMDPATAGLALSFTLSITQEVNYLVRSYCETQNLLVSVERMCEYTDMETEAPETLPLDPRSQAAWPPKHGAIEFDNYSTRYREGLDLVLRNVSFQVGAGEKIGIVGRTGAGKSSLTLALFRMIEAANGPWVHSGRGDAGVGSDGNGDAVGRIVIDGIDISTLGLTDLRRALAIIPQDPILFAGTIRDNLDPFKEHSDADLWEALDRIHLKAHIQTLQGGLSYEIVSNGENFSVGQRSLICLGRALLKKTKILVLDEATSAVDIETDELIQKMIRKEFKDRTLLTIAHRIKTVMDSDKILVLEQGRVVEFDSPKVLLSRKDESLFYSLAEQAGEV